MNRTKKNIVFGSDVKVETDDQGNQIISINFDSDGGSVVLN